jgi:putative hydrolase
VNSDVDWDFARTVANRVSADEPLGQSYLLESLNDDLLELTVQAEALVAEETGLHSASGKAKAKVASRMEWVDANLASFDRLLRPLLGRLEDEAAAANGDANDRKPFAETALGRSLGPLADYVGPTADTVGSTVGSTVNKVSSTVGPKVAGAQVGALLGWMSGRVLGQYDLLIIEDERPEDQDWVYYVGPNVLALEKKFGFPPREFRLWIATHECTHRAQFTGVPWLRPYFLSLVNELLDNVDPDPKRLMDTVRDLNEQRRNGDGPSLKDGGLSALLANPEQRATMDKVTGLMSLLEGHGDITMDRAAKDLIPSQARFARVMSERRKNATGLTKVIHRLTGLEAKLAQYEEGEAFIHAVEAAGGRALFDEVWSAPEALPTIDEIRDPDQWIARMRAGNPA